MSGHSLRDLRRASGLSQWALSQQTGVGRARITLAENGYVSLGDQEVEAIRKAVALAIVTRSRECQSALEAVAV